LTMLRCQGLTGVDVHPQDPPAERHVLLEQQRKGGANNRRQPDHQAVGMHDLLLEHCTRTDEDAGGGVDLVELVDERPRPRDDHHIPKQRGLLGRLVGTVTTRGTREPEPVPWPRRRAKLSSEGWTEGWGDGEGARVLRPDALEGPGSGGQPHAILVCHIAGCCTRDVSKYAVQSSSSGAKRTEGPVFDADHAFVARNDNLRASSCITGGIIGGRGGI
jgi:hypothetical protein